MLVVSGDHHWRTLAVSFRNLLQHVVFEPYDSILPVQADHFISYCSPLFQSSQFLTDLPQFNVCLLYYAAHAITRLGLLLSHLLQHPTRMPSSPHSDSTDVKELIKQWEKQVGEKKEQNVLPLRN